MGNIFSITSSPKKGGGATPPPPPPTHTHTFQYIDYTWTFESILNRTFLQFLKYGNYFMYIFFDYFQAEHLTEEQLRGIVIKSFVADSVKYNSIHVLMKISRIEYHHILKYSCNSI